MEMTKDEQMQKLRSRNHLDQDSKRESMPCDPEAHYVPDMNVGNSSEIPNSSTDCISRQAAVDSLDGEITVTGEDNAKAVRKYIRDVSEKIRNLPSVQPERKKGKWITETINSYTKRTYCSLCDEEAPFIFKKDDKYNYWYHESKLTNFCPNCGSDMRGEQE